MDISEKARSSFWQIWEQNQEYLYHCCFRWMGNNPIDAEDALSCANLKAYEKWLDFHGKITNFKAWLTRLTHNLCMDIYRQRNRRETPCENIEVIAAAEEELVSKMDMPVHVAERRELGTVIRGAIDQLPEKLRQTSLLYFLEEMSYRDIAKQLGISYDNVRKRIQQARAILRKQLNLYLSGENGSRLSLDLAPVFDSGQRCFKQEEPEKSPVPVDWEEIGDKTRYPNPATSSDLEQEEVKVPPLTPIYIDEPENSAAETASKNAPRSGETPEAVSCPLEINQDVAPLHADDDRGVSPERIEEDLPMLKPGSGLPLNNKLSQESLKVKASIKHEPQHSLAGKTSWQLARLQQQIGWWQETQGRSPSLIDQWRVAVLR